MNEKHNEISRALHEGLAIATGCTEPAAIAYAGALARSHSNGAVRAVRLEASGNIIKNAFVVAIPGSSLTGLQSAVSLGVVLNNPEEKLNLLNKISPAQVEEAVSLAQSGRVEAERANVPDKLYIKATVITDQDEVSALITGSHTNVASIIKNGKEIYKGDVPDGHQPEDSATGGLNFSLKDIYDYCLSAPLAEMGLIRQAIELNHRIALKGLETGHGHMVGRMIQASMAKGLMADDLVNNAMMLAAAGSDARLSGVTLPVMSNSGSGNQGLTATIPVIAVWERLGLEEEKLIRACALSNLTTIYIKSKFGVLSALCGAVIAATGVACAAVYLMGGSFGQMEQAIQNVLGNVAGIVCDGAKSGCALKVSTCVNAAMQAAILAVNDLGVTGAEGIVEKMSEGTIENFAMLGREGAGEMDRLVLDMIIHKH